MRKILLAVFLSAWLSCPQSPAQTKPGVDLGRRYMDDLYGFSMQPPADAERSRSSISGAINWTRRDAQTGAIAATLGVHQVVDIQDKTELKNQADLKAYSTALVEKLRKDEHFDVESTTMTSVAGRAAIEISGKTGPIVFWQRQVWVPADATGRFIVFTVMGPVDAREQLNALLEASLRTVRFTDLAAAKAAREANLDRGKAILAALADAHFQAALRPQQQWFLLAVKGKPAGFVIRTDEAVKQEGANGYRVTIWTLLEQPGDKPRLAKQVLFATADGTTERWKEQLRIGAAGGDSDGFAEDGACIGRQVVCAVDHNGKVKTSNRAVPAAIPYLPRATSMLLPRLLDLSKPAAYAFGTYTTAANDFDLRTFTVLAAEKITVNGRPTSAVRATDQLAADAEEATLWLNEKGDLLRMQTADGLLMETASRQEVLRYFPKASDVITDTQAWASQK